MKCPGCGAAIELVRTVNDIRCPQCGGFLFQKETGDDVVVVGDLAPALCPLCQLPLVSALIEDEAVCYCSACRGFLAKIDTFSMIVSKRRALHRSKERRTDPFDPAELKRVLTCPNCHQRMEAHPYFGGGNAVVDTCESCALIWLDAGEFAIIERYLPHVHQIERTLTHLGGRYQGGPFDMPL